MSIASRVILAVALQKTDAAPHAKGTAQTNNDSLQNVYCAIEKIHIKRVLITRLRWGVLYFFMVG